jgi:hypothetical protein
LPAQSYGEELKLTTSATAGRQKLSLVTHRSSKYRLPWLRDKMPGHETSSVALKKEERAAETRPLSKSSPCTDAVVLRNGISAPRPVRPHEAANIIHYESTEATKRADTPASLMVKALEDLENLIDQMSVVAKEASEVDESETFHTPTETPNAESGPSGDGSSDIPILESPKRVYLNTSNFPRDLKDKELPPIPGSSRKAALLPQVPDRGSSLLREREPTILLNSPEIYPKGGAADLYYRDWAYANRKFALERPVIEKAPEGTKFSPSNRELDATDTDGNRQYDPRVPYGPRSEPENSPLHRATTVPLPWTHPDNADIELGIERAHTEKWPTNQGINRYSLSGSPPVLAFTKHGHISHVRHQPVARKWNTSRKRLTAAMACVNTFVVGFQVGIYVSMASLVKNWN